MISYLQIPLVDIVTDKDIKRNIGYAMIAMLALNVVLNFGTLLVTVIMFVIEKIKLYILKRKLQVKKAVLGSEPLRETIKNDQL